MKLKPKKNGATKAPQVSQRTYSDADNTYSVTLRLRHAQWLRDYTKACRITPEYYLEYLVRNAMAKDVTKAGKVRPSIRRGGATTLKDDQLREQLPD